MHAITYCIDAIDAGRHVISTASRTVQGSFPDELAILMQVAESPIQKAVRKFYDSKRKIKAARRSTQKKVSQLVDSVNPIGRESRAAHAQRLEELKCHHEVACFVAFSEELKKNRLILKSILVNWSPEYFNMIFPRNAKLISDAWAKETSDRIWDEFVAEARRK